MEQIFALDANAFMSFLLTLFRVSLVVFLLPFYGGDNAPATVKGALCLVLTLALWPHLSFSGSLLPSHPLGIILLMFSELLMGLMLGLSVNFIFAGIQTGGQMLGFQMGFTMVNVMDPLTGNQISITSHFLYMVALLCFLVMDGHLYMLHALAGSFALVPPGQFLLRPVLMADIITLSAEMFVLAVKVAAPVLASLFLIELALALMARAAPQMNLLMVGMPIKIAVGFTFMGLIFTLLAQHMETVILEIVPKLDHLLRLSMPEAG